MRFFSVHMKPGAAASGAILVKEGFSWPALVFGPLWLAFKRMWLELAVTVAALIVAGLVQTHVSQQAGAWLSFLVLLLLGFEGNGLYRRALKRRGYEECCVITGGGRDEAELRLAKELAG